MSVVSEEEHRLFTIYHAESCGSLCRHCSRHPIGFALWDRRTILRPVESKIVALEEDIASNRQRLHSLLDALRTLSQSDEKVAEVLSKVQSSLTLQKRGRSRPPPLLSRCRKGERVRSKVLFDKVVVGASFIRGDRYPTSVQIHRSVERKYKGASSCKGHRRF